MMYAPKDEAVRGEEQVLLRFGAALTSVEQKVVTQYQSITVRWL